MSLRIAIIAGVVGSLFGGVAAIAVTKLDSPPKARVVAERASVVAPPVHIPSSWDPRFLSRISDVEARLGTLESTATAATRTAPSEEPSPVGESDWKAVRKAATDEQYRQDLDTQNKKLRDHEQEPFDRAWSRSQSEVITQAFSGAVGKQQLLRVGRVDCRTNTCIAELVYQSPDDALADRSLLTQTVVAGCHGLSSALTPPTSAGEYTTTVIYDCR